MLFRLEDRPGALAELGEAMGKANLSFEGGGVFTVNGVAYGHFLFWDGEGARNAAERAGIPVLSVEKVLVRRLRQDRPGQLGAISRALADAHVNIRTQYSDHYNRLVFITDNPEAAYRATLAWS